MIMATSLNAVTASEHIAGLDRVRFAHPDDTGALRRLAELDEAPELVGEILVATIDGDVVAALSLDDGRVVANPFVFTSAAVELLRRTGADLTGRPRSWRSRLTFHPRFV
jgi:hypothetical protein